MTERPMIEIARPTTGEDEWLALRESVVGGRLAQGPRVAEFEAAFAARHEVRHAVAVTSGTTALHVTLAALGVGPGDEVIVPAFTWVAAANVVVHCGATPVLCDIERHTFNLDPALVAAKVGPRTRAVLAVHQFGLCADVDAIQAAAPGVPLVEDAACAAGAAYRGRSAGGLGLAGAFSFHPRKVLTTGEGGMVTTNDDALAARVRALRNHGTELDLPGFNYRMTDLQAAIGVVQLRKLDALFEERGRRAEQYRARLAGLEWLRLPSAPSGYRHGWQSFVTCVDEARAPMGRDALMAHLLEKRIATRAGTHAVHMLGYYRDRFGYAPDNFPAARAAAQGSLALPLHGQMTSDDYEYVIETLRALA
jgi:dTDP-4-amino-4,6-dideoxygalactose transaminase